MKLQIDDYQNYNDEENFKIKSSFWQMNLFPFDYVSFGAVSFIFKMFKL